MGQEWIPVTLCALLQGQPGRDGIPGVRGEKGDMGPLGMRGPKVGWSLYSPKLCWLSEALTPLLILTG